MKDKKEAREIAKRKKGSDILKATALNKIRKIYHPKFDFGYDNYSDQSRAEQREYEVSCIVRKLENDLSELKKITTYGK